MGMKAASRSAPVPGPWISPWEVVTQFINAAQDAPVISPGKEWAFLTPQKLYEQLYETISFNSWYLHYSMREAVLLSGMIIFLCSQYANGLYSNISSLLPREFGYCLITPNILTVTHL